MSPQFAALPPREVVLAWTRLYSRDTQQAALLTTDSFRQGEEPHAWGARVHAALQGIDYQHLGGEIVEEEITGNSALVTLKGRIVAIDGVSMQTEVYTLKRIDGRWLIDQLEVSDEAVPGGKLRHGI